MRWRNYAPLLGLSLFAAVSCANQDVVSPASPDMQAAVKDDNGTRPRISPDSLLFNAIGFNAQLTAVALNPAGNIANSNAAKTWASRNVAIATVDATGKVTAKAVGRTYVTVTQSNKTDSIPVTVRQIPAHVAIGSGALTLPSGSQVALLASATDSNNVIIPNAAIIFSSGDVNVAAVTPNGALTTAHVGLTLITATAGTASVSISVTVTPGAPASIIKLAPTGVLSATVNTAIAPSPSIQVKDAIGNAVTNLPVTFTDATGGTVAGGSTTTDAIGIATAGSWTLRKTTGAAVLTVTAGALEPVTFSATATAAAGDAASSTAAVTPNAMVADGASTANIVIQARDQYGNAVTGANITLTNAGTGTLSPVTDNNDGSYTATLTSPTTVGSATLTAHVGGNDIPGSLGVSFVPGPLHHFKVESSNGGAIATQVANIPLGIRVTAFDANNNVATDFSGTVDITSNLPATGTVTTAAFSNGVLANHVVIMRAPGSATLTATRTGGGEQGSSNAFTVLAPPFVTTSSPLHNGANVPSGAIITVTFSAAVNVTSHTFSLDCDASGSRAVTPESTTGSTFTLTHAQPLPSGEVCTVHVVGAEVHNAVTGVEMQQDFAFSFTTRSNMTYVTTVNGGVAKETRGWIGEPDQIDVDGDRQADLSATVHYNDGVDMNLQRIASSPLNVTVEAKPDASSIDARSAMISTSMLPSSASFVLDALSNTTAYNITEPMSSFAASVTSDGSAGTPSMSLSVMKPTANMTIVAGSKTTVQNGVSAASDEITYQLGPGGSALPAVSASGISVTGQISGIPTVALHAFGAKSLSFDIDKASLHFTGTIASSQFLAHGAFDAQTIDASVNGAPSVFSLDAAISTSTNDPTIAWSSNATATEVQMSGSGYDDLGGNIAADVKGVPTGWSINLPLSGSGRPIQIGVTGALVSVSGGPRIDELRAARGADATLAVSGGNDKITYHEDTGANDFTSIKLTNVKGLLADFDQLGISLQSEESLNGGTKPIDLSVTLNNLGGPSATISGVVNKPSFNTAISLSAPAGSPVRINLTNGTAAQPRSMSSLTLNAQNYLSFTNANFSFANASRIVTGCISESDGSCRAQDRVPASPLPPFPGFQTVPATNATGGGMNRPWAANASLDLNDQGSSGSSSAISSMITMNATYTRGSNPAVSMTNVRFHRLNMDAGANGTFTLSPAFLTNPYPKVYAFIDSNNLPFVMNRITLGAYKQLTTGADASPATANQRLMWLPGGKCTQTFSFPGLPSSCLSTGFANASSGSLNCAGSKTFIFETDVNDDTNILNFQGFGVQVLPYCSAG